MGPCEIPLRISCDNATSSRRYLDLGIGRKPSRGPEIKQKILRLGDRAKYLAMNRTLETLAESASRVTDFAASAVSLATVTRTRSRDHRGRMLARYYPGSVSDANERGAYAPTVASAADSSTEYSSSSMGTSIISMAATSPSVFGSLNCARCDAPNGSPPHGSNRTFRLIMERQAAELTTTAHGWQLRPPSSPATRIP